MKSPRRMIVLGLAVALAAATAVVPAQTASAAASGSTPITVFLKSPDPAGLAQLAAAQGLPRAERLAALTSLVPGAAQHDAVSAELRSMGYRITSQDTWSINAVGPTVTTDAAFGVRPSVKVSRVRAVGALPAVPAALGDLVSAVYPSDASGPPVYKQATARGGADFRNAYTPAKVAPTTGLHDSNLTIATLQLSDFYGVTPGFANSVAATDLHQYARRYLGHDLAPGQYTAIKIGSGPDRQADTNGGDLEVALDQESILSTAPTARQRAYFAPNTINGYNDVFARVFDDVTGRSSTPDRHIAAMSVSWGQCESMTDAASIASLEPILQSLVAAGVTIFASSGDYGIYDCGLDDAAADVDYPASSPSVVGVGATYLTSTNNRPNTGTNWNETGWRCVGVFDCQDNNGGSGGGASGSAHRKGNSHSFAGFAMPAYQQVGITNAPFAHNAHRLVPDISANGSPASGFRIWTGDTQNTSSGTNTDVLGGTSLASPISAAQLTNVLGDAGRTSGIGQIHGALYSAYLATRSLPVTDPRRAFRDVTVGRNGNPADRGSDPSVYAQPGYDTMTGLGSPLWSALKPYLLATARPVARASIGNHAVGSAAWRPVTARWTVGQGADPIRLGPSQVAIYRLGSSRPVWSTSTWARTGSHTLRGAPGATYEVRVTARDIGLRTSPTARADSALPVDDTWFTASRTGWVRVQGGRFDVAASHLRSTRKGATLRVGRTGRVFTLRVHTGPASGYLGVMFNGRRIATIDLRTKRFGTELARFYSSSVRAYRTFTFVSLGPRPDNVDALYVGW